MGCFAGKHKSVNVLQGFTKDSLRPPWVSVLYALGFVNLNPSTVVDTDFSETDIELLSEEMKDGLRHLAQTLQLYLKTEIQDESQLPPAIDFFQIFTKCTPLTNVTKLIRVDHHICLKKT
ncbi:hypothetical protein WISP_24428 [Willisornis vidua]|uniref:Uncharacterized protein n=1 Tax=Willisornis vidua TaxID=1566151 RepID=A0ABQ9DMR8_9PASS|nr:hypothetical protein WISP_24428 [Willisornis vidua]